MSLGEKQVYLWTANVGGDSTPILNGGEVICLDVEQAVDSPGTLWAKLPGAEHDAPLGVVVDKTKLDQSGAAEGKNIAFQDMGRVYCNASAGAIAVGDKVAVADTSGNIETVSTAATTGAAVPIVGTAETATAGGGKVLVRLEIGSTF